MRPLVISILALLLSVAGATANPNHHPAAGKPEMPSSMLAGGMMGMMRCPTMGGHTEGALAFLKTELKIGDTQTSAWNSFADAYRQFMSSASANPMMQDDAMMGGGMGKDSKPAMSYPQRMKGHMEMMKAHLEAGQKFQGALDDLYATLNADQKKSADDLLPKFTMMGHMM